MFSEEQWRALTTTSHPLFQLPNVSNQNIECDELHIMRVGTSAYAAGSILWMLVFQMLPGSAEANMEAVCGMIVDEYKRHRTNTQYTNLRIGSFVDEQKTHGVYPKLKSRWGRG